MPKSTKEQPKKAAKTVSSPRKTEKKVESKVSGKGAKKGSSKKSAARAEAAKPTPAFYAPYLNRVGGLREKLNIASAKNFVSTRKGRYLLIAIAGLVLLGFGLTKFLVLGFVDGRPITRIELYNRLEGRYGQEQKSQLIDEALILSEAGRRGVNATDQEIDAEMKKIEDQQGGADKIDQILQVQGMTRDDLRKQLKFNVLINKMFAPDNRLTDEELNKYLEDNKDQLAVSNMEGSEAAQFKQSVADQLRQQKIYTAFNNWLKEAKSSSRVTQL